MIIAHIIGGVVDNRAVYDSMEEAEAQGGELGFTPVDIGDLPVNIGDEYRDGKFYRDGVEIEPQPDETELLREALNEADEALGAVLEVYE